MKAEKRERGKEAKREGGGRRGKDREREKEREETLVIL